MSLSTVLARLDRGVSPVGVTSSPRADERISAVMVLLADGPQGAEVLLTRRSSAMTNHRGEISFPGGRADEGESIVDAARRETFEEVGIHPSSMTVHCELSPLSTFVSRSYIVPVIASVPTKPILRLNDHEVERAFWIPLAELVRADTYVSEFWTFSTSERSTAQAMHFFYLDDETVWGATARMLHELLTLVHS
ncbi:MAG: NUDIX hydrolase [Actinomycetota bacterium]